MAIVKRGDRLYQLVVYVGKDPTGKQITRSRRVNLQHLTQKQAEKEVRKLEADFEREVKCLDMEDMRFSEYIKIWLRDYAKPKYRDMSLCSAKRDIERFFLPAFGHLKMRQITSMHIQRFYNSLLKPTSTAPHGYATNTIQKTARQLSPIFSQAVRWKIISENPCTGVSIPKNLQNKTRERNYFTEDEALKFFQYIQKEKLRYVLGSYLAAIGSMRAEEIAALEEADFDFEHENVSIRRTAKRMPDGSGILIEDEAKTEQSLRTVYLPQSIIDLAKALFIENKEKKLKLGTKWAGEDHMYLFSAWNGRIASPDSLSHWFTKILREYNLCHQDQLPHITLHGLRHTSATLLIANGVDIKTVQKRLGHARAKTTMDIYVHALSSGDQKAADILERTIAPKTSSELGHSINRKS